jgi:hypothetical protein
METQLSIKPYLEDSVPLRILLVMIFFVTACSVLQKRGMLQTDSLSKVSSSVRTDSDQRNSTNALRIYDQNDSSDRHSYTEIFPDGNFKYSDKEGFSGQAKRVLIASREKQQSQAHISEELMQTWRLRASTIAKERAVTSRKVKEKTAKPDSFIWLYIVGCLIIYLTIYMLRRKMSD